MKINAHSLQPVSASVLNEQRIAAEACFKEATAEVLSYKERLETSYEIPIVIMWQPSLRSAAGTLTQAWKRNTPAPQYLIELKPPEMRCTRPHMLAHELVHLDLDSQAKAANKLTLHGCYDQNLDELMVPFLPAFQQLSPSSEERLRLANLAWDLLRQVSKYSYNFPTDMVAEKIISERLPALAPAQFLRAWQGTRTTERTHSNPQLDGLLPPNLRRAWMAYGGALALLFDKLSHGKSDFFAYYQTAGASDLAESLYQEFERRMPLGSPGEEHELVDACAEIAGLPEKLYHWANPADVPPPSPTVNRADLLRLSIGREWPSVEM
jgi:hypothetical protein